ncbi:MAG: phage holin family protein [Ferruginibacter sp.]|nr:phage holin family protein [Ferruginibacter sp.]
MNHSYIEQLLLNLIENFTNFFKYNPAIKTIIAFFFYFAGIHVYLYCVFILVIFDVITGIKASMTKGEKFTSRFLKKGLLEKLALYLILILAAFFLELVLKSMYQWDKNFIAFLVTMLISTYEMVSICENILIINPNLEFLKGIIKLSKSICNKAMEVARNKVDVFDGKEHDELPS